MQRKLKVLVADDSPEDAFLIQRAIEKTGVSVNPRFVTDGQEAIEYLAGENHFADRTEYPLPALIILDVKMPRKCPSMVEIARQPSKNARFDAFEFRT